MRRARPASASPACSHRRASPARQARCRLRHRTAGAPPRRAGSRATRSAAGRVAAPAHRWRARHCHCAMAGGPWRRRSALGNRRRPRPRRAGRRRHPAHCARRAASACRARCRARPAAGRSTAAAQASHRLRWSRPACRARRCGWRRATARHRRGTGRHRCRACRVRPAHACAGCRRGRARRHARAACRCRARRHRFRCGHSPRRASPARNSRDRSRPASHPSSTSVRVSTPRRRSHRGGPAASSLAVFGCGRRRGRRCRRRRGSRFPCRVAAWPCRSPPTVPVCRRCRNPHRRRSRSCRRRWSSAGRGR